MANYLILCSDLFFTSKVGGTAEVLGYDCLTVMNGAKAISSLSEMPDVKGVIIDLTTPGLNLSELLAVIPKDVLTNNTIAFGPHVEREALAEAEAAGCVAVLTRSQFTSELPETLKKFW